MEVMFSAQCIRAHSNNMRRSSITAFEGSVQLFQHEKTTQSMKEECSCVFAIRYIVDTCNNIA